MLSVLGVYHTQYEGFHAYSAVILIYLTIKNGIPFFFCLLRKQKKICTIIPAPYFATLGKTIQADKNLMWLKWSKLTFVLKLFIPFFINFTFSLFLKCSLFNIISLTFSQSLKFKYLDDIKECLLKYSFNILIDFTLDADTFKYSLPLIFL